MSYISHSNLERLLNGFKEFFRQFFEAIDGGRLEEALTIAENAMAFITEILESIENESSEDANVFVFVETPQR
jgi:hypothetical protein